MKLTEAEALAKELFQEHHLNLVGWRFEFDRARVRFGVCRHGIKLITMSKILTELNDEEQVRDTLLHEIAHALVGSGHGHDKAWKQMAKLIGARPERTYSTSNTITPERTYREIKTYYGNCPNCNGTVRSRSGRRKWACAKCCRELNGGKYSAEYAIVWE